jgi:radical SAM protein with 4Fe4S-binding SPASM domain
MNTLEITTQIGCPLMCTFCPQDKLRQAYTDPEKKMSMATFTTVLSKLPKTVRIVFAGYTEPWANNLCNDFVELALTQGFDIGIYTTLYNINPDQCDRLIDLIEQYRSQIKDFWVHLPDQNKNMIGFRYSHDFEYTFNRISKIRGINYMTMDSESRISPEIKTNIKPANWYLHTRANNLNIENINNQPVNEPPRYEFIVECTRNKDYHANVLLPNGDIILCCMDYGLKHQLGNLLTQSYDDILNGAEIQKIHKLNNQLGFTQETLCKSCNDAHCHTPWNNQKVWDLVAKIDPDSLGITP